MKHFSDVEETQYFPAWQTLSKQLPQRTIEVAKYCSYILSSTPFQISSHAANELGLPETIVNREDFEKQSDRLASIKEQIENRLDEETPEWAKEEMSAIGATNLFSQIGFTTSLSGLIFDIYKAHRPRPSAPLAAALEDKKEQEVAENLADSECKLDPHVEKVVERVTKDDQLWEQTNFSFKSQNDADVFLNKKAIAKFHKIQQALISLLLDTDLKKGKKKTNDAG